MLTTTSGRAYAARTDRVHLHLHYFCTRFPPPSPPPPIPPALALQRPEFVADGRVGDVGAPSALQVGDSGTEAAPRSPGEVFGVAEHLAVARSPSAEHADGGGQRRGHADARAVRVPTP